MRNIKLVIEYDGKGFNGWQKQPTKLNIQGEIERAIKDITGEEVDLIASGRTDAGVHSLGQVANFKTNSNIPIEKFNIGELAWKGFIRYDQDKMRSMLQSNKELFLYRRGADYYTIKLENINFHNHNKDKEFQEIEF